MTITLKKNYIKKKIVSLTLCLIKDTISSITTKNKKVADGLT